MRRALHEGVMRRAIVIGILGLGLISNRAAAQTAVEQAQILRDFEANVATYAEHHKCLDLFPEAVNPTTPAPKIFTLPVAMVFRQLIGHAISGDESGAAIGGVGTMHQTQVLRPLPPTALYDFPKVLSETLPGLPAPLEYRLIDNDLVIRDAEADLVIAVLRDATATATVSRR
jgi:hypothetical protein